MISTITVGFFLPLIVNLLCVIFQAPVILYPIGNIILYLFFTITALIVLDKQRATISNETTLVHSLPKTRLLTELKMAKRVQQGLLMVDSPDVSGIKIAKKCVPADNIGGDFYSFIDHNIHSMNQSEHEPGIIKYTHNETPFLGIVIGDVAGHGVSSALIMALSAGLFTEIGKRHITPKKVLAAANKNLIRYIENSQVTHVTAFYGMLNIDTKMFHYCRAGHPSPILYRNQETIQPLDSAGCFLGMFDELEFYEESVQLQTGDRLFFYTDGITEAKGPDGGLFGNDRLMASIRKTSSDPIGTSINQLFEDVDVYTEYQKALDDRSLVILEISS